VFRRAGGADHGAATAGRPGWTLAHRAALEINGGRGEMEVLGVTMPMADALETLRAVYAAQGGEAVVSAGTAAGWGVARVGGRVIRFLAIAPEGPRECVVFRLEQTDAEFERSMRGTDTEEPAGGRARRVVADAERGIEARTIESGADPEAAAGAIGRALAAEGWQPAIPGAERAGLYLRDGEACVVRVTAGGGPGGGGSRALVVRQRLGGR